ncbi:MAG: hypothetical protein OEZ09_07315 [Betaproteobacteria bacterium]|nr:hypothetical protein [Betaproteobacteria bacterium]MDH5578254.1 hypothetical protein [Betaproteobacteria bacterium]
MKRAAAALVLCAALVPRAALAQELGRLFFTPEQRAALDARRKARLPDKPAALAPSPTTRVDGSVTRSSGRSTIWLDGYAVPDGVETEGLRVRRSADPGRVIVTIGEEGRRVDLRVGETLDRATGEVKDVIGTGEVRIERRGAARR